MDDARRRTETMPPAKTRVPAIDGWFSLDPDNPQLLGTRCADCGTVFFPKETTFCRNPECTGSTLEEVPLSSRGRLWSFTNNCYPPPAPYVAPDPFEPYAIAAVELEEEKMVILGQVVAGVEVADLEAGMEMEVVVDKLYEDDDHEFMVWKWRPVAA
jgi:uncharacterized OB-fold protein